MRGLARMLAATAPVALLLLLTACSAVPAGAPRTPRSGPIELDGVEVTEYEGKDLSSVEDFRENSIRGPQYVEREDYRLVVDGLVGKDLELTYDEVIEGRQSYEKVVELNCVEGWSVTILWEGVLVRDILDEAGVSDRANTVVFHAVDGYSSSLPLEFFYDRDIIMAHRMNGVTLPPERGFPFQLVAEEKWGYKWVKWIERIELVDDPGFEGYWESRGYDNEADVGGPIFEDE